MSNYATLIPDGYYKIIGYSREMKTRHNEPYRRVQIAAEGQAHIVNMYKYFHLLKKGRVVNIRFDAKMNIRWMNTLTELNKYKLRKELEAKQKKRDHK